MKSVQIAALIALLVSTWGSWAYDFEGRPFIIATLIPVRGENLAGWNIYGFSFIWFFVYITIFATLIYLVIKGLKEYFYNLFGFQISFLLALITGVVIYYAYNSPNAWGNYLSSYPRHDLLAFGFGPYTAILSLLTLSLTFFLRYKASK